MINVSYFTKLIFCLNKSRSFYLFFINVILLAAVFCLEFISISSLTLIFSFLGNSGSSESILSKIGLFSLDNYLRKDLRVFAAIVFFIFLFKNVILLTLIFLENKFVMKLNYNLSKELYEHYLNKNLFFFKNNNSSILFRNITEIKRVGGLFKTLQLFIRELIIVFSMISIMLFTNTKLTVFLILILMLSLATFYFLYKNFSKRFGKEFQIEDGKRIRSFYEGIESYRESKIYKISNFLKRNFLISLKKVEKAILKTNILTSLPKIYFELIAIISFMLIIYFLFDKPNSIYVLSIFAITTLKLLPSFQSIVSNFGFINFYNVALNLVYNEFNNKKDNQPLNLNEEKKITFHSMKLNKINFEYPNKEKLINELNLEINKNDKICIFGESGSGKSTLLDIMTGLIEPSSGKIHINNLETSRPFEKINIGFIPQEVFIYDSNILNNITLNFGEGDIDIKKLQYSVEKAQLTNLLPKDDMSKEIITGQSGKKISGGQKQRIGIARALYHNFDILLLDEFTNSLDKENEEKILRSVKELDKTVVCVSHNVNNFKFFDKVFHLIDKRLVLIK